VLAQFECPGMAAASAACASGCLDVAEPGMTGPLARMLRGMLGSYQGFPVLRDEWPAQPLQRYMTDDAGTSAGIVTATRSSTVAVRAAQKPTSDRAV
jgi:hypothetical protein